MKTVYMTQTLWGDQQLDRAVGETQPCAPRPGVRLCAAQEGKVIDLAAWKAENLAEAEAPEEMESGLGEYQGRELVRRPRRKRRNVLLCGELAATLSVAGVMLAMMLRVLVF